MAGRKGSITTASNGWSFVVALVAWLVACTSLADPAKVYLVDLRTQSVADALNGLSEQTGVPVVFPYDLVKNRKANPVVGRFTLQEALDELLKDTGLSGGLSDKGVVNVSLAKADTPTSGETSVPHDENKQNTKKTRVDKKAAIATFFASIVTAFSASAEDVSDVDTDQARMSSVVVTAEKRQEREQDVPVSMTVLDPNVLTENGQYRLEDYFSSVPGLNLESNTYFGGTNYLTIRGLSSGERQNSLVGVVIDDVPAAPSLELNGGQITPPDLDPSDLARIEVLKGPQGTLYGASAMGGLIKYVTVDPSTQSFSGRAEVTGVDDPDGGLGYAVRGVVNIPVSDAFALRFSGFDRRDPGFIDDLTTGQKNFNSADVYGGRVAALLLPSENLTVKLSALVQQKNGNASTVNSDMYEQFPQGDLNATGLPGSFRYSTQNQLYSANVDWKVAGLDIVSITGYVVDKFQNWNDFTVGFFGSLATQEFPGSLGSAGFEELDTKKISEEVRLFSSIGSWLDWRLAGFYGHEETPNANAFTIYAANLATGALTGLVYHYIEPTLVFSEHAVFGDATAHITSRFDVDVGGRESWYTQSEQALVTGAATELFTGSPPPYLQPRYDTDGSAFTFLVTPKFTISKDFMVYARVASGYRVGGTNGQPPSIVALGVPADFGPDKTTDYELGTKFDFFDHRLSFDAAAYYINWPNFQTSLSKTINDVMYGFTANSGHAKSEGLELSLESHPIWGLTITAQGSFEDAVLTQNMAANGPVYGLKGDRLPYSVRSSGGLTVNQDFHLTRDWIGFFGGSVNYVGSRPYEFSDNATDPRFVFPGYTEFNLKTGARYKSWLLNLYVNNVGDRRAILGITGTNAFGATGGYVASVTQPRTVGLSVARTF